MFMTDVKPATVKPVNHEKPIGRKGGAVLGAAAGAVIGGLAGAALSDEKTMKIVSDRLSTMLARTAGDTIKKLQEE